MEEFRGLSLIEALDKVEVGLRKLNAAGSGHVEEWISLREFLVLLAAAQQAADQSKPDDEPGIGFSYRYDMR